MNNSKLYIMVGLSGSGLEINYNLVYTDGLNAIKRPYFGYCKSRHTIRELVKFRMKMVRFDANKQANIETR